MRYAFDAVVLVVGLGLYTWSSRAEPRRWRNGVYLLAVTWAVVAAGLRAIDTLLDSVAWNDDLLELLLPWALAVLIGAVLIANGVRMLTREGRTLGNLLSFVLGLAMAGGTFLGLGLFLTGSQLGAGSTPLVVLGLVVLLLPGYPALVMLSYLLYCLGYLLRRARPARTAIVVLGSGLVDGQVPTLLANRLDAAMAVRRAEEARGNRPLLVPTGGQGEDEPTSEGAAMTAYLVEHGLDPADVLTEERAATTEENVALSRRLLGSRGIEGPVRVVTSSYHVGRAALITRRLGVDADVTGAPTAWYFLPSAFIREVAAAVRYHPWVNAVGLLVWAGITALLTHAVIAG
jgi:uncharacterized SAM-binding protein YcdF (DUF218 family)